MVDFPESHVSFGEGTLGEGWLTNHDLNKTPKLPSKSFAAESFFSSRPFLRRQVSAFVGVKSLGRLADWHKT